MDKNKNRTDLLAAGRKKLQQFRQKKDGKGGKSGKAGKTERGDGSKEAVTGASTLQQVPDEHVPLRDAGDVAASSESHSILHSELTDTDDIDRSSEAGNAERMSATMVELPLEDSAVGEATTYSSLDERRDVNPSVSYEGESTHLETLKPFPSDETHAQAAVNLPVHLLSQPTVSKPIDVVSAAVEVKRPGEEEQEVDNADFKQVDGSRKVGVDEKRILSINDCGEGPGNHMVTDSGNVDIEEETHQIRVTEPEDALRYPGIVDHVAEAKQNEEHIVGVHHLPKTDAEIDIEQSEHNIRSAGNKRIDMGNSLDDGSGVSPINEKFNLSSGSDIRSISSSQLAALLQTLNEDDMRFLLMSREPSMRQVMNFDGLGASGPACLNVLERLNEQFYLTRIEKDLYQIQLAEQSELQTDLKHQIHELKNEKSLVSALLADAEGRNEILTEELVQCRSGLQKVICSREELQQELYVSRSQVEELVGRTNEMQKEVEIAQAELLNQSSELAQCRKLVADIEVQKENLCGSLNLLDEKEMKLTKEKEFFLHENDKMATELALFKTSSGSLQSENEKLSGNVALLMEERRELEEQKAFVLHENEKLSSKLADCESLVETLQMENATLLESVRDSKKIEGEKDNWIQETDELNQELVGSTVFIEVLGMEISNVQRSLALVTEHRNRLEEEAMNLLADNQKQTLELADCKVSLTGLQTQYNKAVSDFKEANLRIGQITEENAFLKCRLNDYEAKLSEFEADVPRMSRGSVSDKNGSSQNSGNTPAENFSFSSWEPSSDCRGDLSSMEQLGLDGSSKFIVLVRHLQETQEVLQKLEKAIEDMHSHSASLSRLTSKVIAPGVSKLIEAFESKSHADDHDAADLHSSENQRTSELYLQANEHLMNLKVLLKELVLDTEAADKQFQSERNSRILADVAGKDIKARNESLKAHADHSEEANIELLVFSEVLREHVYNSKARENELVTLYEALRKKEIAMKVEKSRLIDKLDDYEDRISTMQNQFDQMVHSSDETLSFLSNKVESLLRDVSDRELILVEESNSTVSQLAQPVEKLDAAIEVFSSSSTDRENTVDFGKHFASSIHAAITVIERLQNELKTACTDHQAMLDTYNEMNEKFNNLEKKNELAMGLLHNIHNNLRTLVTGALGHAEETETHEEIPDSLSPTVYDVLLEKVATYVNEKMQLESVCTKLNSDLIDKTRDIAELNRRTLDLDAILKLVEEFELSLKPDGMDIDKSKPAARVDSLLNTLVQKCNEADVQLYLSRDALAFKDAQLCDLQAQLDQLSFSLIQYDNETFVLKESLKRAKESVLSLLSELQDKVAGFEQSEQRVSSLREKLSIAVTKGKGLIVQRDGLKQSLAATSSELEKCTQELQVKNARVLELETKLKAYSEAGERMEALESELSYIRNSSTALRESFILKDSVLQRIEEILEDLELPEHFHSRDIIEKIDWLAKSVTGNAMPFTDWDPKSSGEGGSYPYSGVMDKDGWSEEPHRNSTSGDDLARRYQELQSKFYELAEQTDMLEQSLMEQNNLVQRWEDILGRIDMPPQMRSTEPEIKIEWLGGALAEARERCSSLDQKIENLDTLCGSLTDDLQVSQNRISELEAVVQSAVAQKEVLLEKLEILTNDNDEILRKIGDSEFKNDNLQIQVHSLLEKLDQKLGIEEHIHRVEGEIKRLQELIVLALRDSGTENLVFGSDNFENLELSLRQLIEQYQALATGKAGSMIPTDNFDTQMADLTSVVKRTTDSEAVELGDVLKERLEDALNELTSLKEDRERFLESNQSLVHEIDSLNVTKKQLQGKLNEEEVRSAKLEELLNQEVQKSASLREKLNTAVRKGKSLVQQRDSMKQIIEEANAELENLKSVIALREDSISVYETKIADLVNNQKRMEALESESLFLRNQLGETERSLQAKEHTLSMILDTLASIDVGMESKLSDPVVKLKTMEKLLHELNASVYALEQESRKSKRAAELLLAELNEVQERNDHLQEELTVATDELSRLSRQTDLAEAAKRDALAHVEKLSAVHSEERDNQYAELTMLKYAMDQMKEELLVIDSLLGDVLSSDIQFVRKLGSSLNLCLQTSDSSDEIALLGVGSPDNIISIKSENEVYMREIVSLKQKVDGHSHSLHEEAIHISEVVRNIQRELISQRTSSESMKRDISHLQSIEREKDSQLLVMQRDMSLLFKACTSCLMEIEKYKTEDAGDRLASSGSRRNLLESVIPTDGKNVSEETRISVEEIRTLRDKLLLVPKYFEKMHMEILDAGQKEMKAAILNLQNELQQKDIQRERICTELVGQIKEAETTGKRYLQDFQATNARAHDLQKQIDEKDQERILLELRIKDLQDREASYMDLEERVRSLTDAMAAKEEETEALIQALDEEEGQMEDLTKKIERLESTMLQKNKELENLEASRGKALKKLSLTVSKFDELHHLSKSLLSEVEKLQSQLQDKDAEISFLRQEVTRCTNDALVRAQMSNIRGSEDLQELLAWLGTISQVKVRDVHSGLMEGREVNDYKVTLQKQIISIVEELEDLQAAVQNRDMLLQVEKAKVQELMRKEELLEYSLHEKESQLVMLRGAGDPGQATNTDSEIVEVEPVINKRAMSGSSAPQVRSLRKSNNDQVAIAIDEDSRSGRLEDEDDDKAHGFKSLTTSRIIPRFTRPVTDIIDGLWVSCDRALMRQPALRLSVIMYWALLHALLATLVI